MHGGVNAARGELRDDGIAIVHVNHELVVNTFIARIVVRHLQVRAFEQLAIFLGNFAALLRPCVQAAKIETSR